MSANPEPLELPDPETPFERKFLFIAVYGTAVLALLVLLGIWGAMVLIGDGANYPDDMRLIVWGLLTFLFGGALGVKLT